MLSPAPHHRHHIAPSSDLPPTPTIFAGCWVAAATEWEPWAAGPETLALLWGSAGSIMSWWQTVLGERWKETARAGNGRVTLSLCQELEWGSAGGEARVG